MIRHSQYLHPSLDSSTSSSGTLTGYASGQARPFTPDDLAYAELQMVCPQGQTQTPHDVAWQHENPVPLLRNVQRLTAPNPGVMTGPGTNTYLIGQRETGYIVMDPGPWGSAGDEAHLRRLLQATMGDIRHIVCTHSHPDHSPASIPLQQRVLESGRARPPVWGMASASTARADSYFRPDRHLQHGDVLAVQMPPESDAPISHSLQAIFTPGHAANHLCFLLQEDALLFCGDHILSGSTTVVIPPDGNMNAYLQSLDVLQACCNDHQVQYMLPAHGHVLGDPIKVIQQLRSHRLRREAKVLQAIQTHPTGNVENWLAHAYADAPRSIWPVARFSLQAHAERIALVQPELADSIKAVFAPLQTENRAAGPDTPH